MPLEFANEARRSRGGMTRGALRKLKPIFETAK
jgi:hypothetical protein